MRELFTTLVTLSLLAPPALAQPASAPAGDKPASKTLFDHWDAAFLQGGRAGYVHTFAEKFERDGHELIRTTVELRLRVKRFSDTIELGMDAGDVAAPDGKVLGTFMRQTLGPGKTLQISGVVEGDQLRLTSDGKQPLKPAPWNEAVIGQFKQHSMMKDRAIKVGDRFDYAGFEPTVNLVLKTEVEAKRMEEIELPGTGTGTRVKVRALRVESRPQPLPGLQLPTLVTWLDKNLEPVMSETEIPGLGTFRMVRTTNVVAKSPGSPAQLTDIGVSQLIRLKQPIARPYDTSSAVYRITIRDDGDPGSAFVHDGRQQVKNVKGDQFELHVTASAARAANAPANAPAGKELGAEFTQSSYFINSADKRVRELASRAVGKETDPWTKALRIERWVHDNMKVTFDQALATADHVARTLQGDCTEFSMLTAAMCRAEGIPSRTALGLVYADVRSQAVFAFHMWTEVWAGGEWRPLDATQGKGRISATHLKIGDESWHEVRDMKGLFPVVRVLGRIRIEVVRVSD
jgi:transglutaminase-like putative cysteine protease